MIIFLAAGGGYYLGSSMATAVYFSLNIKSRYWWEQTNHRGQGQNQEWRANFLLHARWNSV